MRSFKYKIIKYENTHIYPESGNLAVNIDLANLAAMLAINVKLCFCFSLGESKREGGL